MQVILLERIVNLGQLGDVVKVKEGYARNFLIPHGKARRATETAIKEFEGRRAELEKVQADKFAAAQSVQERLNGGKVQLTAKAGVDGRLFGSITNYDIAEALGKQGFDINKAQIRMPQGPLKAVGDHTITVALHSDLTADITVTVVGEQA
jgi:large subunit ribosomal protein L9